MRDLSQFSNQHIGNHFRILQFDYVFVGDTIMVFNCLEIFTRHLKQ